MARNNQLFLCLDVHYWLGGRDDSTDGIWTWSSSDRVFTYTAWGPGEPNGHANENCLDMHYGHQWKWNDDVCTSLRPYVCEKKLVLLSHVHTAYIMFVFFVYFQNALYINYKDFDPDILFSVSVLVHFQRSEFCIFIFDQIQSV